MRLFLAAVLLASSTLPSTVFSQYGGQALTKKKQDDWMRCLKSSYKSQRAKTADKNMAAELSMQACASEEEALWTYSAESGVPRSVFMHLKTQTKKVLIDEGL